MKFVDEVAKHVAQNLHKANYNEIHGYRYLKLDECYQSDIYNMQFSFKTNADNDCYIVFETFK